MFQNWIIDNKSVLPPLDSERLTIDLTFTKGTLSESQPLLSFDKLVLTNEAKDAYLCAVQRNGPYQQVPITFDLESRNIFDGYLTDSNYLLELDEIEVKPVSNNSTDGLSERLSAIESSLLSDRYNYQNIKLIVEKTELNEALLQLALSTLLYAYILYTQIKEIQRLIGKNVEATTPVGLPVPAPNIGAILSLIINLAAQIIFLAITIIQLIKYAKDAKELLFPKTRNVKMVTLFELCRAPLEYIGYNFVTDIDDMSKIGHLASGDVDNGEFQPRSTDVCGNALGAINFVIKKFSARVFVKDKTVYIVNYYSPLFFKSTGYNVQPFPSQNYKENIDDMTGTREIIYSTDTNDKWTLKRFQGTEYIIRANIADPTKSTIKGLKQRDYGVALCNRKNELNSLQKAFNIYAGFVNGVIEIFGGSGQGLRLINQIGFAMVSSQEIGVAKLVWFNGEKIPANHRDELSAKADENKYHYVDSHVRNPRAKKRIYSDVVQKYNEKTLSCNINSNLVFSPSGTPGELTSVSWEKSKDKAVLNFEIEDINRETKLIETFYEPLK